MPLITSDYEVNEVLTLLRSKRKPARALALGEQFFSSQGVQVVFLSPADIREAWNVFKRYADKKWSFTDCSSKVVMERLGISRAFAFDQYFRQFGTVQVVP